LYMINPLNLIIDSMDGMFVIDSLDALINVQNRYRINEQLSKQLNKLYVVDINNRELLPKKYLTLGKFSSKTVKLSENTLNPQAKNLVDCENIHIHFFTKTAFNFPKLIKLVVNLSLF